MILYIGVKEKLHTLYVFYNTIFDVVENKRLIHFSLNRIKKSAIDRQKETMTPFYGSYHFYFLVTPDYYLPLSIQRGKISHISKVLPSMKNTSLHWSNLATLNLR